MSFINIYAPILIWKGGQSLAKPCDNKDTGFGLRDDIFLDVKKINDTSWKRGVVV